MNANQAQAGITRLLQLGETTVPVVRVERSVSENSFDQHMKRASTQEPYSRNESSSRRNEPSSSRNDARDTHASSGREAKQGSSSSKPPKEDSPKSESPSEKDTTDTQDTKADSKVVNDGAKSVAEDGFTPGDKGENKDVAGLSELVTPKPEALTEFVSSGQLVAEPVETFGAIQESVDILNGGVLSEDGGLLNVDTPGDATPVEGEFTLTPQIDELGGSLMAAGQILPVSPGQLSESIVVAGSGLQPKVELGLREQVPTAPTGLTTTASGVVPEDGVTMLVDPSLTNDTKVSGKASVPNMAITSDQSSAPKSVATMTPQADQWFKQLAAEPQGPELRSAQAGTVSAGAAVSDMAKAQSRLASSMVSQGTMGPLQTQVKTPFGATQWGGAVAERVAFLASQRVTAAEIHLDPPELGPLQVRVSLNQEQASVSFVAQHAGVREALDQNAFRLREMLDAEGLDLVDVDVSGQSFAEQDSDASGGEGGNGDEILSESDEQPEMAPMRLSLVDHFV